MAGAHSQIQDEGAEGASISTTLDFITRHTLAWSASLRCGEVRCYDRLRCNRDAPERWVLVAIQHVGRRDKGDSWERMLRHFAINSATFHFEVGHHHNQYNIVFLRSRPCAAREVFLFDFGLSPQFDVGCEGRCNCVASVTQPQQN